MNQRRYNIVTSRKELAYSQAALGIEPRYCLRSISPPTIMVLCIITVYKQVSSMYFYFIINNWTVDVADEYVYKKLRKANSEPENTKLRLWV